MPLLSVKDLSIETISRSPISLLKNISFDMQAGETLCVVGESGSGKSLTALSIMRLLPEDALQVVSGEIMVDGHHIINASKEEVLGLRGTLMSMVFQEPMTALNPIQRVGHQIDEAIRIHRRMTENERRKKILAILEEVGLSEPQRIYDAYPHELSGGQRQRIVIAIALILEPKLIIADEPTTALDVSTQNQILNLMKRLQRVHGTAIVFITHDFGVVYEMADRIVVMRKGEVVEQGTRQQILTAPTQDYTRELISSVPNLYPDARDLVASGTSILVARTLSKTYEKKQLFQRKEQVKALKQTNMEIIQGEILGIVGESGSGKSTLARCIAGLITATQGNILLNNDDIPLPIRQRSNKVKQYIQVVFQDPYRSLNPRRTIRASLLEGPRNVGMAEEETLSRIKEILQIVDLDEGILDRYPHQFSGGQRQRICIARAIAMNPSLLIADEAVSALDVTVQARVLSLLQEIRDRENISILFITHDLRVAAQMCDRIFVMNQGVVIEQGTPFEVIGAPQDDYTKRLIKSAPGLDWDFVNFRPAVPREQIHGEGAEPMIG